MLRRSKIFDTIVPLAAIGALLPVVVFAQFKISESVTTVTTPTETMQLNTVTGVVAPYTAPTKSVTTDALIQQIRVVAPTTQDQTIKVFSPTIGVVPTSPTFIAPTKIVVPTTPVVAPTKTVTPTTGIVAPVKITQPSTAVTAPTQATAPQKTTTAFPFTPTAAPRSSDALTTVSQYAAAQVIYRVEPIDLLLKVAEQRGEASAVPLPLDQFPGNPTIAIDATADGEFAVDVAGAGRYSVNATVYDIDRNALAQFSGASFVVPWTTYDDPASFVINIAYLPAATLTSVGGFPLPPPTGVTPIAPTAPTAPVPARPVAVQPVTPGVPEAPVEVFELTYSLVAIAPVPGAPCDATDDAGNAAPGAYDEDLTCVAEAVFPIEPIAGAPCTTDDGNAGTYDENLACIEEPQIEEPPVECSALENVGDFIGTLFGGERDCVGVPPDELPVPGAPCDATDDAGNAAPGAYDEDLTCVAEAVFPIEPIAGAPCTTDDGSDGTYDEDLTCVAVDEGEDAFFEELFTPDLSAPEIPDYGIVGDDIVVSVPLDDIFDAEETPLVASLVFTPISGGSGLEFSEPIDSADVVTFNIPRAVLSVLGPEMRVLLKTTATLNGLLIVSTDVLGVARNE